MLKSKEAPLDELSEDNEVGRDEESLRYWSDQPKGPHG
jgi:hypothetical protein